MNTSRLAIFLALVGVALIALLLVGSGVTSAPLAAGLAEPRPVASPKPILTGVSSTFTDQGGGVITIRVHVVDPALDGAIHGLEIFFGDQEPVWHGASPISGPPGWFSEFLPGGIGFYTTATPLQTCQPVQFTLAVLPPVIGDAIVIHVTDRYHNNMGNIISQRTVSWTMTPTDTPTPTATITPTETAAPPSSPTGTGTPRHRHTNRDAHGNTDRDTHSDPDRNAN